MKLDNSLPLEYRSEENSNRIFGFWLFLGAEIVLFSTLFAVYFTLWNRTGNGPSGKEIFEIGPVLIETFVLLTSSFTIGLVITSYSIHYTKLYDGMVLRSGKTGENSTQIYEFALKLDSNPEFTASVLVAYARAVYKLSQAGQSGARTVFDIPFGLMSPKSPEQLRKEILRNNFV